MKIFIQGRKDGYNTLYPKPTPAEFFQFAADIQRIDAQNNVQYYGKSLYAIAFNGSGCIFTKYIIGYDTLRSNIGNIGISVFIPNNQKMSGADIKTLLDELIKIYTTNYCPDFKINNQKQEDWPLFQSAADSYNSKVKTISADENYQYGNKDAAYIFYNNTTEIEKYLETPYQEEFKERKQVFFIDNQSQLLLEVIKHDQTANLTGKIDLENPSYKLRDYHGQGKEGISIEIRANGKLRYNNDKIFRKDNVSIKYSKKYREDIFKEGKLSDPHIAKYLKLFDNLIDVEKSPETIPTKLTVEIRISDSKGTPINNAIITYKNNYSNTEKPVSQNTIVFSGEEIKDKWTISAKKDNFSGEETFTPEFKSVVKLTLREVKTFKLIILNENGIEIPNKTKVLTYYDDDIRRLQNEHVNIPGYQNKTETFIPKDKYEAIYVKLEKQVNQQPTSRVPKGGPHEDGGSIRKPRMPFRIKILIVSFIACILVVGAYFLVGKIWPSNNSNDTSQQKISPEPVLPKLDSLEIERYVEGDSLLLVKLNKYKVDWANLKDFTDSIVYKKYDEYIDNAIKKREAIDNGEFAFLSDTAKATKPKYSDNQQQFKFAVFKIKQNQYEKVKRKLGNVSKLTLTTIADSINKILVPPNDPNATTVSANTSSNKEDKKKVEEKAAAEKAKAAANAAAKVKENADADANAKKDEKEITDYLQGEELRGAKLKEFEKNSNISGKLKISIQLALAFWELDGVSKKTYFTYKSKVQADKYLKNNGILTSFLEKATGKTYPKNTPGAGNTLTLSNFIDLAK